MRTVIIGTDFLKDIDGSFKAIETNTNIQTEVPTDLYFHTSSLDNLISGSSINEIVYITKQNLNGISITNLDLTENPEGLRKNENLKNTLQKYCVDKNYTFTPLDVDDNAITVPYVEDTENKLIIRISYDTTAVIDDLYSKDNWEFLKLMYDTDANLIPKCYINDTELGIDNIGTTLRDNGNHPNYLIKKRFTPADNRVFPNILKINTIEELETIKQSLEVDEYIQEYIYNPNDLLDNRIKHYRSVDLLYGSSLEVLNLWCVEFSNSFEIDDWKSVNDDAISSTSCKESPSLVAPAAALANNSGLFPRDSFILFDAFAASLSATPWLTADLFDLLNELTTETMLVDISLMSFPPVCAITARPPASSAESPIVFFNSEAPAITLALNTFCAFSPICLVNSPAVLRKSTEVAKAKLAPAIASPFCPESLESSTLSLFTSKNAL